MCLYSKVYGTCYPKSIGPIGIDGSACPVACPITCPEDHMHCGGGMDANGCPMPDTCTPISGDCPVTCPVTCPLDHIQCPGGVMPDGCPMPDTCMPVTANCPAAACPAVCNFATDMTCPGGVDASGCMLPDTCMPQTGINYNIDNLAMANFICSCFDLLADESRDLSQL